MTWKIILLVYLGMSVISGLILWQRDSSTMIFVLLALLWPIGLPIKKFFETLMFLDGLGNRIRDRRARRLEKRIEGKDWEEWKGTGNRWDDDTKETKQKRYLRGLRHSSLIV